MGHRDVFVLDGGLKAWLAEGRPVESGWREPPHGEFKAHPVPGLVRGLDDVRGIVDRGGAQLVDARSAARFRGEAPEPRPGLREGHMPGARNVAWSGVLRPDGALADAETLKAAFAGAGVDLDAPIVTTCGSGISAAILALALARLGRDDVAVYDGSWSEWGARSDTPVATGP
jgi:thiosulfate/3-mercaptopyruvate sulfurtransferase